MQIIDDIKYDFSDVLILPKRSALSSRGQVDLKREFKLVHSDMTLKGIPIMAANMDNIGTWGMARQLNELGMMTALGKHYSVDDLVDFFKSIEGHNNGVFYSVGISDADVEKFEQVLSRVHLPFVNIDVANGYTERFIEFVRNFRKQYGSDADKPMAIMAGNVVTGNVTEELILNGADIVKVGIGGGALCTTRRKTGIGYPQLSAVMECADAAHGLGGMICSDGGCVYPSDVAKAFAGGGDFVMLGSMLAGHEQGLDEFSQVIEGEDGQQYVKVYGMSSASAMKKHYGQKARYRSSEGREVLMPFKGDVVDTIEDLLGGLRSTCTYVGARKLKELHKRATFIRVNNQLNQSLSGLQQM